MNKEIFKLIAKDVLRLAHTVAVIDHYNSIKISVYNDYEACAVVIPNSHSSILVISINPRSCTAVCFGRICNVNVYAIYNDIINIKADQLRFSTYDYLKTLELCDDSYYISEYMNDHTSNYWA